MDKDIVKEHFMHTLWVSSKKPFREFVWMHSPKYDSWSNECFESSRLLLAEASENRLKLDEIRTIEELVHQIKEFNLNFPRRESLDDEKFIIMDQAWEKIRKGADSLYHSLSQSCASEASDS